MRTCEGCGGPLAPNIAPGKPRKWCSDRCRKRQYAGECVDCGGVTNANGSAGIIAAPRCSPCSHRREHEARYWTPERIIAAIRAWKAEHGQRPMSTDWQTTNRDASRYPPANTVQRVFGTWSAAIMAAVGEHTSVGVRRPRTTLTGGQS